MKKIYCTLILLCFFSTNAHAQFFKKLGDKAKEAAERTLERKAEEKTEEVAEKSVDSIFGIPDKIFKKKKKNKAESIDSENQINQEDDVNEIMQHLPMDGNSSFSMGNASYQSSYVFAVTATIEVEETSANLQKMTMKQGYGKEALITEMENNSDPIIIDMKNQSAIMLNINQGIAQIMSLEWMQKMMGNMPFSEEETNHKIPNVTKTGNTKMMNGYKCHEYNITFEDGKINAWYAPDVKFEYQDYLRGMAKLFSNKKEENPIQLLNTDYGYVMQMTFYNSEDEKQNSMKVIGLNEKVRMINMDMFKVQKL